jgi:hypothetical protein
MDGKADPLVRHDLAVLLIKQDRDQSGLPVVTVNDIWALPGPEHELQGGLGEEREPLRVVCVSVQAVPGEEVSRMRFDEEAFAAVRVAEPHRAADGPVIPRHLQVVVAGLQVPDIGVPHAGVLRQDDLDSVPAQLQFAAQPGYHIARAAGAHSGATITTYIAYPPRNTRGSCCTHPHGRVQRR